ncbi:MAG: DMT family transporter [Marinibacterium sp.]
MDLRALGMGLAFALMWSSAFSSARIIVAAAPPLYALSLRFLISGLIAVIIARLMGQSWWLSPAQWRATILFGICQNALYLGLNFVAMQWVEASLAAIIASAMPLLVALTSWLFLSERLGPAGLTGLIAGTAGVALIMGTRISGGTDILGVALCVAGVLALTFATLAVRGATSGGNFMMIVGVQMLIGAGALLPAAMLLETPWIDPSPALAWAFAYTTLVPGVLATYIWVLLLNRIGPVRAATFHFLNPVFGVAVAAVLLGESLGIWDMVGVAIVTAAILVVQTSRMHSARGAPIPAGTAGDSGAGR